MVGLIIMDLELHGITTDFVSTESLGLAGWKSIRAAYATKPTVERWEIKVL